MTIISKTIEIKSSKMPPSVVFIEQELIKNNIEPLRWAIVDVNKNNLLISASGRILNNVN